MSTYVRSSGVVDDFREFSLFEYEVGRTQVVLRGYPPVEEYEPGTWGPESASNMLHGHGGWRTPWLPGE